MKNITKRFGFFGLLFSSIFLFSWFDFQPAAFYIIFASNLGMLALLERWVPFRDTWNDYEKDWIEDLIYALVTILVPTLAELVAIYGIVYLANWLVGTQNLVSEQHFALQLLLALLVSGFFPYWYHRLSHEKSEFLWKIHSIHHSPEKLYWLNGFRFHPVNTFLNAFLGLFPLLLLGIDPKIVILTGFINNYVGIANHANVDFRLGIFNFIFNMSEIHRWHHSAELKEGNHNYSGSALVIWDLIFGTFYLPGKKLGKVGLFSQSRKYFPYRSILRQLAYPIRKNPNLNEKGK